LLNRFLTLLPATTLPPSNPPPESIFDSPPSDVHVPEAQFAYGSGSFANVFSPKNNFWYVDRTSFIPRLEALKAPAVVSLRPRRMGKTLWKDTLVHYYDALLKDQFKELFGHLDIGKAPTQLANTFHVLPLTFAGLKSDTVEEIKMSLNNVLNTAAAKFKQLYNLSFKLNEQDSLDTFVRLVTEIQLKHEKVQAASQTPLFQHAPIMLMRAPFCCC